MTVYKLVSNSDKEEFEKELNQLASEGYIWSGSLSTVYAGRIYYSQLMMKYTPNEPEPVQQ